MNRKAGRTVLSDTIGMHRSADRAKNRIKSSRAFTLAETLVATIIMLLVSIIMVAGIPAAIRAYNNVVISANAEVLLSTAMTALRNELSTSTDIRVNDDHTSIIYYNEAAGSESEISLGTKDGITDIMYSRFAEDELIGNKVAEDSDKERFISREASDRDKDLHVKYTSVTYDSKKGIVTFTGLAVTDKNGKVTPAALKKDNGSEDDYSIRIVTDLTGNIIRGS